MLTEIIINCAFVFLFGSIMLPAVCTAM